VVVPVVDEVLVEVLVEVVPELVEVVPVELPLPVFEADRSVTTLVLDPQAETETATRTASSAVMRRRPIQGVFGPGTTFSSPDRPDGKPAVDRLVAASANRSHPSGTVAAWSLLPEPSTATAPAVGSTGSW
jgi:hypothetical protein